MGATIIPGMQSMTGFGTSSVENQDVRVEATIRSVNSRYFECRWHLPREYQRWEDDLRKILKSHLHRGSVDVYVYRRLRNEEQIVEINEHNAKRWVKAFEKLGRATGLPKSLDLFQLSQLPGVVENTVQDKASDREKDALIKLFRSVCQQMNSKRQKEGDALKKTVVLHLKDLDSLVGKMRELFKRLQAESRKRRANEPMSSEGALAPDKTNVTEELDRLAQHIKAVHGIISKDSEIGKKLDFYCQELLREANTIGSKSQNAQLTELVIGAKDVIEQIREQVQNVE